MHTLYIFWALLTKLLGWNQIAYIVYILSPTDKALGWNQIAYIVYILSPTDKDFGVKSDCIHCIYSEPYWQSFGGEIRLHTLYIFWALLTKLWGWNHKSSLFLFFQLLHMSRMWHKVNFFQMMFNWFGFRAFLLLDQ